VYHRTGDRHSTKTPSTLFVGGSMNQTTPRHRVATGLPDYDRWLSPYSPARPIFTLEDVLDLPARKPEAAALNAVLPGVNGYRDHLHELRTISQRHTRS